MGEIEKAAAGAISKSTEYGLAVTILVLAVIGLAYLHHVCRRENAENRKDNKENTEAFTRAMTDASNRQNETNLKMNESLNNLSNVVAVLTEVVRSK